ncbi:uncharacterized protein LOC124257418 [Haliotis rubra]|uniref:uncharacterized protein LOC124257418 n=1 Tax=Haliotis rubra TaxID=36100 RepID=UPI001EE58826|nr:uncharacterized protein LOC124257418 [Haliotis rubra]
MTGDHHRLLVTKDAPHNAPSPEQCTLSLVTKHTVTDMKVSYISVVCLLFSLLNTGEGGVISQKQSRRWTPAEHNPFKVEVCYTRCSEECGGYCLFDTARFRMKCMCSGKRAKYIY